MTLFKLCTQPSDNQGIMSLYGLLDTISIVHSIYFVRKNMKKQQITVLLLLIGFAVAYITACKTTPPTTQDPSPPMVQFTSPMPEKDISVLRNVSISVNASPSGNKTIKKVEFFVDDVPLPNGTLTQAPWNLVWNSTDKFGQVRVIKAVATDNEGVTGSASISVTVFNAVEKAKMPTPRYSFTADVVNGKIYVIGGHDSRHSIVEEYDPATDTWTTKAAPMFAHHAEHASCVVNNVIYLFGGGDDKMIYRTVQTYTPATNSWSTKAPIPQDSGAPISGNTAALLDGKIYLMGGLANPEPSRVAEYNPATDSWRMMKTFRREYNAAALTIKDSIYFVGGCRFRSLAFCDNPSDSLLLYNPRTDTWSKRKNMLARRTGHATAVLNNKIYVLGGSPFHPSAPGRSCEVYDPATDTWKELPPLPISVLNASCCAVNGKLYIITEKNVYEYTPE